ncbi:hypothetical protein CEAn_00757 [Coxiella endosymbiont of Amblyomma nuttalli]|nr:hypothetical protein CEAn_00757 [Coxiella endosymbiont of Amblyomma nuttalli]
MVLKLRLTIEKYWLLSYGQVGRKDYNTNTTLALLTRESDDSLLTRESDYSLQIDFPMWARARCDEASIIKFESLCFSQLIQHSLGYLPY